MAAKVIAIICLQVALFNVIQGQVLNRIPGLLPGLPMGGCGCGCGPNILPVADTIIPNQVLLPNYNYPTQIVDYGVDTIVSNPVGVPAATTIIQDSTVANNLANALQLLVVSNLLSNTLPTPGDYIVPNYAPGLDYNVISPVVGGSCGYGAPFNYIY